MNRKISLGVAIALMSLAAAVAIVITAGYSMYDFNGRMQSLRESEVMYSKLNEIDGYVRQNFYGDIDEEELMNAVAKGYVSGLGDKYARYMTPEEYQAQMEAYESQKASIGVSVVMDPSGYMKVIEVFADSPAEEAGIEVGDLIVEVEGTMVTADNYSELSTSMGGEEGSTLNLVVRRDSQDDDVEIVRRNIEVPMVTWEQYGDVGYIKIKEFHNNTPAQFNTALKQLTGNGVKALEIKPRLPRKLAGAVTRPDGNGKRIASGTGYKCFGLFGIGINGFAGRNGFLDPGEPSEFGFDPDPPVMSVLHDAAGDGHILLKRQV